MRRSMDPQVLSLLDLLSNMLGEVIVLVMLLAAIHGVSRVASAEPRREGGTPRFDTNVAGTFVKGKEPRDQRVVAQLILHGVTRDVLLEVEPSGEQSDTCEVFQASDASAYGHWLVVWRGSARRPARIVMTRGMTDSAWVSMSALRGADLLPAEKSALVGQPGGRTVVLRIGAETEPNAGLGLGRRARG